MEKNNFYNSYTDLLKDKRFLQWQLMSDETMNGYWEEVFIQHPGLEKELQRAILYLKKEGLNRSDLDNFERTELLGKIQRSVLLKKQKIKNRDLYGIHPQ